MGIGMRMVKEGEKDKEDKFSYDEVVNDNTIIIINKSDKLTEKQTKNAKYYINVQNKPKE